mgnify:FL=1
MYLSECDYWKEDESIDCGKNVPRIPIGVTKVNHPKEIKDWDDTILCWDAVLFYTPKMKDRQTTIVQAFFDKQYEKNYPPDIFGDGEVTDAEFDEWEDKCEKFDEWDYKKVMEFVSLQKVIS